MKPIYNFAPIQAARGIAVLLVMLFHASQKGEQYFSYNYLGVSGMGKSGAYTFFFALTGYLMYTIYHRQFGRQEAAPLFLVKRFLRIYPIYWLIMLILIPIYFLYPSFGVGYERKPSVIIESLLLWPQEHAPIIGVAWSLSYVVWFYLAFSLFFLLKEKAAYAVFSSWFTIIVLNVFGIIHLKDMLLIRFLFSEVHLEFFSGMLVAYAVQRRRIRGKSIWWIIAGSAVYPLLWLLRLSELNLPFADLLYTIGSALVLVGVATWKFPEWRVLQPFVACGDASYSILLTSLPMMSITFKLAHAAHIEHKLGPASTTTLCFVFALMLCLLFYRMVEKPLQATLKKAIKKNEESGELLKNKTVTS